MGWHKSSYHITHCCNVGWSCWIRDYCNNIDISCKELAVMKNILVLSCQVMSCHLNDYYHSMCHSCHVLCSRVMSLYRVISCHPMSYLSLISSEDVSPQHQIYIKVYGMAYVLCIAKVSK